MLVFSYLIICDICYIDFYSNFFFFFVYLCLRKKEEIERERYHFRVPLPNALNSHFWMEPQLDGWSSVTWIIAIASQGCISKMMVSWAGARTGPQACWCELWKCLPLQCWLACPHRIRTNHRDFSTRTAVKAKNPICKISLYIDIFFFWLQNHKRLLWWVIYKMLQVQMLCYLGIVFYERKTMKMWV